MARSGNTGKRTRNAAKAPQPPKPVTFVHRVGLLDKQVNAICKSISGILVSISIVASELLFLGYRSGIVYSINKPIKVAATEVHKDASWPPPPPPRSTVLRIPHITIQGGYIDAGRNGINAPDADLDVSGVGIKAGGTGIVGGVQPPH